MMSRCTITLEELTDYGAGACTPAEAARLRLHLESGCPVCRTQEAALDKVISALHDALTLSETPISESTRAYARSLSHLRPPVASAQRPPLLRWIATLVSGAGLTLAQAGVRGTEGSTSQWLYETEAHLITLWEERRGPVGSYVIGQIYRRQDSVSLIPESILFTGSSGATWTAHQKESEFHISDLLPDMYLLQCWLDEGTLLLPQVRIGGG